MASDTGTISLLFLTLRLRPCGFDFQDGHWDFALTSGRTMSVGSTQPLIEKSKEKVNQFRYRPGEAQRVPGS